MKNWKSTIATVSMMLLILCEMSAQSSVWKIEGKGTTMYIGGTIHVLQPDNYPLPAEFESAYAQANTVVLEADLKELEDSAVNQIILAKSMYPAGDSLSNTLKKQTYEALKGELAKLGIPVETLEQFKPSMVILTLTMYKLKELGITAEGVDKHYYEKAVADKKSLGFFETTEQQIEMIVNMGKGNEDLMVMHSLKDLENMENDLMGMLSDWKRGTSEMMDMQIDIMITDFPGIYKSLLVDRNAAWIPKLEKYLEDENVEYILVGTLHLHGPDGLLKQMKNKGYTVTQVVAKAE